jgi:hypothetical protein
MSKHTTICPQEAADSLAIREFFEAYAHCADRRDEKGQMSLAVRTVTTMAAPPASRRTAGARQRTKSHRSSRRCRSIGARRPSSVSFHSRQ